MFDSFLLKFNESGVAEVVVESEADELKLGETINSYNAIHYLEDSENQALEAQKLKDLNYLKNIIVSKDEEIKTLKLSIEELATLNIQLKTELKYLRQDKKVKGVIADPIKEVKEKTLPPAPIDPAVQEGDLSKMLSETEEKTEIYKELSKKTVVQLKELLEQEVADKVDEWKVLVKKEDIIFYLMNKID